MCRYSDYESLRRKENKNEAEMCRRKNGNKFPRVKEREVTSSKRAHRGPNNRKGKK